MTYVFIFWVVIQGKAVAISQITFYDLKACEQAKMQWEAQTNAFYASYRAICIAK